MTPNGYSKMQPLGLDVRADMLETVAGYPDWQFVRELSFACSAVDINNADSLRWIATLCARRVDELSEEATR